MGTGRRWKKQGPPPSLEEPHLAKKRKVVPEGTAPLKMQKTQPVNSTTHRRSSLSKASDPAVTKSRNAKNAKNASIKPSPVNKAATTRTGQIKIMPLSSLDDGEEFGESTSDREAEIDSDGIHDFAGAEDDALDDANAFDHSSEIEEDEFSSLDEQNLDEFPEVDLESADNSSRTSNSDFADSDAEPNQALWSDDDDDAEEALTAANIEGLSNKLDAQAAQDAADAQAELEEQALQTNIATERPTVLDGVDEENLIQPSLLAPNLQLLRTRITDNVRILGDFSNLCESGRSRAEYTRQLLRDICAYYGYSEFLAEKLFNLFTPSEAFAFFEANETPRPVVIRTNTLRTHRRDLAQALINRGVTLEPVGKWTKIGLQVFESQVPLGATPEYLAGHYILQAASSFLPVIALAPQEHERVLDMASAPGGKVTHIAALMRNTGSIFANDSNKDRAKALIGNIHRLGAKNTIVCNYDAREFPKVMGGFDRVLLDAPCSGTGVIAKDASVKTNKTPQDFLRLPHLQKQLLLCAIDSVDHSSKTGGYVVYSTCSVTVEENEQVVQYALNKRPNVKLVETGISFGKEGFINYMTKKFHPSMKETRRYYPHAYNVDGFFVAKFKKLGPTPANAVASGSRSGVQVNRDDARVPEKQAVNDDESGKEEGFGGWDEEEDQEYIERGKRQVLRKKGMNPKHEPLASRARTDGMQQILSTRAKR
ncbi:MAG: rRNA (cytosine-C5-)-methyltransferase nop2 [Bathelium mastoideum]|nr:MAG: rRNA (cytosine-C5-)-methyltransferase nop2 [Bathelium mastoideum]KAI9687637.1 MAG: rRNA (cytosine-C5-)-methyltransferase nop2 [Bathelium mastoideum]